MGFWVPWEAFPPSHSETPPFSPSLSQAGFSSFPLFLRNPLPTFCLSVSLPSLPISSLKSLTALSERGFYGGGEGKRRWRRWEMECERVRGENQGCQHHAPHPPHAAAPAVPFPENGRGACVAWRREKMWGRWKRQSHQESGDAKAFSRSHPPPPPTSFPSPRKPAKWAESGGGRQPMRGEGSREGERASFFLPMELSLSVPLFSPLLRVLGPESCSIAHRYNGGGAPPSLSSIQQPVVGAITAKHFAFPLSFFSPGGRSTKKGGV